MGTACLLAAFLGGCGDHRPPGSLYLPPDVRLEDWQSLSAAACQGTLANLGTGTARDVRVSLLYSIAGRDSILVVTPVPDAIPASGRMTFSAPPQVTRSEPRFPRLASIHWTGGTSHGEPEPIIALGGWCRLGADSARARVFNDGGLAYHLFVRIESGDGVIDVPALTDPLGTPSGPGVGDVDRTTATIVALMRDSAGVSLPPTVIKAQWEDFAGVEDSVNGPVPQDVVFDCEPTAATSSAATSSAATSSAATSSAATPTARAARSRAARARGPRLPR